MVKFFYLFFIPVFGIKKSKKFCYQDFRNYKIKKKLIQMLIQIYFNALFAALLKIQFFYFSIRYVALEIKNLSLNSISVLQSKKKINSNVN